MCNIRDVVDQIKEIAANQDGTPTQKLLAILIAAGVDKTADLAAVTGLTERAIQKAKANHSSANSSSEKRTTVRKNELQFANSSSGANSSSVARVVDNNTSLQVVDIPERKVSKTPLPPKAAKPKSEGPTPFEALQAFEAYNATALRCRLPQAAKFTPDRQRKIIARLRDYGLDGWNRALANIEKAAFLTGANDRGWRADLEFVLQPSSFAKLHDGSYGRSDEGVAPAPAKKSILTLINEMEAAHA